MKKTALPVQRRIMRVHFGESGMKHFFQQDFWERMIFRKKKTENTATYDPKLRAVIIALLAATAPHVNNLKLWVIFWCLLIWGFIWYASGKRKTVLPRYVMVPGAIAGFGGALLSFGGALYTDTYVALLSVMAGLKPLEAKSYRDHMLCVFLAYFMVITNLFYSDEVGMTLYMFASVLLTTVVLIHLQHPAGLFRQKSRVAAVIMLQAIPVMLILFFLFPRIQGNVLGIARRTGRSGFSDTMSPGRLSNLARNNDIAFRVSFDGPAPRGGLLYWRGIVFLHFDGSRWSKGNRLPSASFLEKAENPVNYTITLEPHNDRWLFALDMPGTVPSGSRLMSDYTLLARRPVSERKMYKMTSYTLYDTGALDKWEDAARKIPRGSNPRAAALAEKWSAAGTEAEEMVNTALRYFRENEFYYTLEPPLLGRHAVDDFLFETRRGYCEHYASAFVFLMRAAGIPARVVGGYQGGEMNPYGEYMIVRQSHAHAWAEVWISGKGWTRADPTASVAPARIEGTPADALAPEELFSFFSFPQSGWIGSIFRNFGFGWDMINTYWNLWIMTYSLEDQAGLLARLGIRTDSRSWPVQSALLAIGLIALFIFLFTLRMWRKASREKDRALEIYERFCRKMERKGFPRKPAQGPADYADRLIAAAPDQKEDIARIRDLYIRLRYGQQGGDKNALRELALQVRRL